MPEEVLLQKEIYGTATYTSVIDTEFTQLVTPVTPEEDDATVDRLFQLYDSLFYQIELTGDANSHEYIVKRSSQYLGGAVLSDNEKALIDEINSLRQQLLEANKSLTDIAKLT
jgi:hypothetical protein